ncbi:MAG: hypothetical protein HYX57_06525 [Chloroflexi bacterium]|nr:hypothetical protein [Chloroflexota bacterium]
MTLTLGLVLAFLLSACQGAATAPPLVGPGATATAAPEGPEPFVAALKAAGADARLGQPTPAGVFDVPGLPMCIGKEPVLLFVFGSTEEAIATGRKIDPSDPSNMGTTMVEWIGRPRFWQRDRMLVLYLGEDRATDTLLRSVLGEPFASGAGGPALPDPSCA